MNIINKKMSKRIERIEIIDESIIKSEPKIYENKVKTIFISDMDVNYPSNGLFICIGTKNIYEKIINYLLSNYN
jgi:hypothetical protein